MSGAAADLDLLCLGEPMAEFAEQADGLWRLGVGGDVSNVAVAAARQEIRSGVAARLGQDSFGDAIMAFWAAEGVDAASSRRDPLRPTGVYFIRQTDAGHVFEYRRQGSAATAMGPDALPGSAIEQASILHVSGVSQAISRAAEEGVDAAVALAKSAGRTVSFDPNLRLKLWPLERAKIAHDRLTAAADIVLPGLDDARELTGLRDAEEIARRYLSRGAEIVALTMGADGVLIGAGETLERLPSLQVAAVDATGAGDCFDGAFLAEWLRTGDPIAAGRYAVVAAALSVRDYGATAPIPREAEVRAALAATP